jgi:hypothetical protein
MSKYKKNLIFPEILRFSKLWFENSACAKLKVEGQGTARVAIQIEIARVMGTK